MDKINAEGKTIELKDKVMFVLMAVIIVLLVVQTIQIFSLDSKTNSNAITGNAALDMSGWTDEEKMMYEHHGTLPAGASGSGQSSGGMVGGC